MSLIDLLIPNWKNNPLEKRKESIEYWIHHANQKKLLKIFPLEPDSTLREQIINHFNTIELLEKLANLTKKNNKHLITTEDQAKIKQKLDLLDNKNPDIPTQKRSPINNNHNEQSEQKKKLKKLKKMLRNYSNN